MKKIFLTGSTGFVGKNIINYLTTEYSFNYYKKNTEIVINDGIVLHLAGIAHDLNSNINCKEYYDVNTELTKKIFDKFLLSNAKIFIFLSSIKAVADNINYEITEESVPSPISHYGKSKLKAEEYILSKSIPSDKRVFILRPCMIYGPGNKGNFNLLNNVINKIRIWPFGLYENRRSYLSVENLCFIIKNIIERDEIESGIYNVADNESLSTNDIIKLIANSSNKTILILNINKYILNYFAKIGDIFNLPFNTERLNKITNNYLISNRKIMNSLKCELPISSKVGIQQTFNILNSNIK